MSPPKGKSKDIGKRIRKFRQEREMSVNHLAEITGISKSYLWSLENEESAARPSGETLYAIAKALGVTMSDLLGRRLLTDQPDTIPQTLQEFAKDHGLPATDVQMLARIQFRGEVPKTKERWQYIYDAIRTSEMFDRKKPSGNR